MTDRAIVDTNIVIGILNGTLDPRIIAQRWFVVVSAVTVMELYALAGASITEERRIDAAVEMLPVLSVTPLIAKRAGLLARTRRTGKPDLLIAATALVHDLPLVTRNARDFRRITGLVVFVP